MSHFIRFTTGDIKITIYDVATVRPRTTSNHDSIFGMKRRAIRLLKSIVGLGLDLLDVNGVNTIHLVKKSNKPGWLVPDEELIALLAEVGFKEIVLPFESANLRIINLKKSDHSAANSALLDRWCHVISSKISSYIVIAIS